ncbi:MULTISPECIES: sigma-70 family RNA polymerase sigma factor [Treponema]|uniref:RNA polymerase sigma-70 factor, region 2 family n=1 Tax=Treponema denticola (strain ATCC 35405 / DSM 14222 / CIP 103919 / JCM 8153 / KCTC 15104) TaxID=243275 RepID=Q73RL8_TREDE|nr:MULTISPECIES: RNA polymerase sigma factor RpoD/SigA [Treponema]AAS10568.1 RNA polymerase sigma-70 factor, region 2 family [Treponema denticola ATCC 35405]EMB25400.1 sigma-70 family RNA polymerase sigma factor [Treponema denticola SP37]EMB36890.1 sigma-70 family RNA polymerase sigma factor [Treponema denticola ATCC 35404]EMB40777.1 sigma-70 family RNA polymerase sigma factor [Treponema denticola ATCC 33521]EMB42724.1 sigma-70 family RNA polymerase sigma factor [Treponema denticola ATCC 33520
MTENLLLQYIKDSKKYPLLSAEQEAELADEVKKGNTEAIEVLVTSNLRLVIKMAKKFSSNENQILELIQEGNMGLMKAASKFSKSFKVRFSSYAAWWIKQSFIRYLNSADKVIKLPVRKEALIRQVHKEEENYKIKYGILPSYSQLAEIMKEKVDIIAQIKSFNYTDICSLDDPVDNERSANLYDFIPCNTYNPEEEFIDNEFKEKLNKCLEILNDREKDVLRNRYGLDGTMTSTTFAVLGKKYSISAESIRQTQLRALKKLRADTNKIKAMVSV